MLKVSEQKDAGFYTGILTPVNTASITSSKSMLEQEREVLNTLPLPAVIFDPKGVIQAFNSPASKEFGYQLTELLGKNIALLMAEDNSSFLQSLQNGKPNNKGESRELTIKTKGASYCRCKCWVTEKKDSNNKVFYSVVLDPNL
jgi:PAS domain S-box-containing protein